MPAGQSVQDCPAGKYFPAAQLEHAEEAIEPCLTPLNISVLVAVLSTHCGEQKAVWLYDSAYRNTVHQYRGKKHTKETKGRESDHTSRHLEREGTTHEREGEAERSILMTHNSL